MDLKKVFAKRLTRLSSGRQGLITTLAVETVIEKGEKAIITFKASDATLDRYGEKIEAKGWELGDYQKNPVFQANHSYSVDDTIGKVIKSEVRDGALFQTVEFAVDISDRAKRIYELYKGGYLRAVSVGFIPIEWDEKSMTHKKQTLLELSAVAVPANPNALAEGAPEEPTEPPVGKPTGKHLNYFTGKKGTSPKPATGKDSTRAALLRKRLAYFK